MEVEADPKFFNFFKIKMNDPLSDDDETPVTT